jgi:hypothetical protein
MATIEELERKLSVLEHKLDSVLEERVVRIEDVNAIERLQHMYGYYIDMLLYDEMTDLFTENGSMEVGQRGRYVGKENIRKFLTDVLGGMSKPGLHKNQVINHTQHQGIVTILPDGNRARGRWRALVQAGTALTTVPDAPPKDLEGAMMWADGVYENTYVKENGIWKIEHFWWSPTFYVTLKYDRMWYDTTPVSQTFPPQKDSHAVDTALGRTFVPFHYVHPVTGKVVQPIFLDA